MRYVGLVSIFALLAVAAVSTASDITVESDGLKLIAEYDLTGDTVERTVVNEAEMTRLTGTFPFTGIRLKSLPGNESDEDVVLYFDSSGTVKSFFTGENNKIDHLYLLGNTGGFIRSLDGPLLSFEVSSNTYEVYDDEGEYLTEVVAASGPFVCVTDDIFVLSNVDAMGKLPHISGKSFGEVPTFNIYDSSGLLVGTSYTPIGARLTPFDKGAGFIATSPRSNPEGRNRGTRVFGPDGDLSFTLNENILPDPVKSSFLRRSIYGSSNYICQVGQEVKTSEMFDSFAERKGVLEVYDGAGNILWDFDLGIKGANQAVIFLSDNERYLCLLDRAENKYSTFETATGNKIREVSFPDWGNEIGDNYVSDDGSTIAIMAGTENETRIFVIKEETVVGSIWLSRDTGWLSGVLSLDGNYLLVGYPEHLYLFRVKT